MREVRTQHSSKETFDVIVVGAGPAGASAALHLANRGARVLLLERGEVPGEKNMFGGLLPYNPVFEELIPDFYAVAPWERNVVKRVLTVVGEGTRTELAFESDKFDDPPYAGVTLYRPRFDRWLAERAQAAGAHLLTRCRVTGLRRGVSGEQARVLGVILGESGSEACAPIVILCDGALSLLAREAGLRSEFRARDMAVGVRVLLSLPETEINRRFGVVRQQGASYEFLGVTRGVRGGGFIYTQQETLSVGLVLHLDSLRDKKVAPQELLERFMASPPVDKLIRGSKLLEYSAHLLPEGCLAMVPRLYQDGVLVAGDAAALCYTNGLVQEGMNLAVFSGKAAAETALEALGIGDTSSARLSLYEKRLRESFVLSDMRTFSSSARLMHNERLFSTYPRVVGAILEAMYHADGKPRRKLGDLIRGELAGEVGLRDVVRDTLQVGGSLLW